MRKAGDKPDCERGVQARANDGNGAREILHGRNREIGGDNDGGGMKRQQFGRQRRNPAGVASCPTCLEHVIFPFDEAELSHAGAEQLHLYHA